MKFSCNKCETKYSIADEKVRGKVLKIRCKKCENIIVLRENMVEGAPAPAEAPAPASTARAASSSRVPVAASPARAPVAASSSRASVPASSSSQPDELPGDQATKAVTLDPALLDALRKQAPGVQPAPAAAGGAGPVSPTKESTRVVQSAELNALLRQPSSTSVPSSQLAAQGPARAQPTFTPAPEPPSDVEWFLAIQGQQVGPLTHSEVSAKIGSRQADERTYGWCDGMADWKRLADIPEFKSALLGRRAPPPPPKAAPSAFTEEAATKAVDIGKIVNLHAEAAKGGRVSENHDSASLDVAPPVQDSPGPVLTGGMASKQPGVSDGMTGPSLTLPSPSPVGGRGAAMLAAIMAESVSQSTPGGTPLSGSGTADDPFASVPNASSADEPPRESTRMFIAAAGLANRSQKHRAYAVLAGFGVVGLAAVLYLDYAGIYQIPIAHDIIDITTAWADVERPPARKRVDVEDDGTNFLDLFKPRKKPPPPKKPRGPGQPAGSGDALGSLEEQLKAAQAGTGALVLERKSEGAQDVQIPTSDLGQSNAIKDALTRDGKRPTVNLGDKAQIAAPVAATSGPKADTVPLTPEQIGKVVTEQKVSLTDCSNRAAKQGEKYKGSAKVTLTIGPSGKVMKVQINEPGLNNTTLGECLGRALMRWVFPRFEGQPFDAEIPLKLSVGP